QFSKLVALLRRPSMFFFLPDPPTDVGIPPSFRHPPGERTERRLLPEEARGIRTARRLQQISTWVRRKRGEKPIQLPRLGTNRTPERAALVASDHIDWQVSNQIRASNPSVVVQQLRELFEDIGLLVLHLPLTADGCRGFSLYSDYAPLICINTHYEPPARVFSYIHEFGHLVTRTDSICSRSGDQDLERWCEQFAAAFLMPEQVFLSYVDGEFGLDARRDREQIRFLASRFNVSLSAVTVRLIRLKLAPPDLYDRVLNLEAELKKRRGGGLGTTAPQLRVRQWGRAYPRLILEAERNGVLQRHDVLEYLNLDVSQLPALREELESAQWGEP
ncbi:MAG TPA: ImmA/IrrE family metallo-endopeptidase, partial [Candidatus Bathyarchaeia archaeon]